MTPTGKFVVALMAAVAFGFAGHASAAKYTLKYGLVSSDSSPDAIGARMMKERIERESNGEIEVQIFANASLGGEVQLIQQLRAGTVQAAHLTEHSIGNVVPQSRLMLLPFVIKSRDVANKIYDSDFMKDKVWMPLAERNIAYNGMWSTGVRGFHTSKGIIHSPADVEGLKMRVSEAPEFIAIMRAMGANPTPISWSEIYTALSQKVVDGTDTTQYYSFTQKLYEVVPYITVLGQQTVSIALLFNKGWLDSLPPHLKDIVRNAGWDMAVWQRQYLAAADVFYNDGLRAKGATVYYPTKEEIEKFEDVTKDVAKSFYEAYGKEDVEEFVAMAKKLEEQTQAQIEQRRDIRRW